MNECTEMTSLVLRREGGGELFTLSWRQGEGGGVHFPTRPI